MAEYAILGASAAIQMIGGTFSELTSRITLPMVAIAVAALISLRILFGIVSNRY
jgi:hypothetical protein